jgi:YVTN family beta-propeller protein
LCGLSVATVAWLMLVCSAAARPWQALVTNDVSLSNSVSVIDTATNTVEGTLGVQGDPAGVVISPDARTAYVANAGSLAISRIDLSGAAARLLGEIPTPFGGPAELAITPDAGALWLVYVGTGRLAKVDLSTNPPTVGSAFSDGSSNGALDIALSPDGRTGYVTDPLQGQVTPIDLASETAGTPIRVGSTPAAPGSSCPERASSCPYGIAAAPNGSELYVADQDSHELSIVELAKGDHVRNVALPGAGALRQGIAVSPDGATVYVAVGSTIVPVDVASHRALTPIAVSFSADLEHGRIFPVAVTPDGRTLYLGDGFFGGSHGPFGEQVLAVPVNAGAVAGAPTSITTQLEPWGAAITPDQAPVAALTVSPAPPGSRTFLDASSSTVRFGAITRYAWSFGDHSRQVLTSVPRISHVYLREGSYTASVTETDGAGTSIGAEIYTGQMALSVGRPSARARRLVAVSRRTAAPPLLGRTVLVRVASGRIMIMIRAHGRRRPQALRAPTDIPVGSEVDARHGAVTLTIARGGSAATSTARVSGGLFLISQPQRSASPATITPAEPLAGCPTAAAGAPAKAGPSTRRISVSDSGGGFATRARYLLTSFGAAEWTSTDGCTSSTVAVSRGAATVTDLVKHLEVMLAAGQSYTASAH